MRMHTLSLFPYLLSWSQLSPVLIRLALGFIFIFWSYRGLRGKDVSTGMNAVAGIECVAGVLLIIGLWTQAAALVAAIDLVIRLIERIRNKAFLTDGVNYYLLLLVMALSLMTTGPGFWAFDLPL